MGNEAPLKWNRSKSAFLTAALFYLAGFFLMLAALHTRAPRHVDIRMGAMVVNVAAGAVWTAIGVKYKKDAERDRTQ